MDEQFDVIVVGAGLAGLTVALLLAQEGLEVVVVERGSTPGSKNVSGGVLYSSVLEKVVPEYWDEAPLERIITRNTTIFMDDREHVALNYGNPGFADNHNGYSVLRARLDVWLAAKAEAAGVMIAPAVKVDSLLRSGNSVIGIVAGEDEMQAKVVILADGACSFLAEEAGLHAPFVPRDLGVGIKELIGLDSNLIQERFNLNDGEGAAYGIVGTMTRGVNGGGFLYTNRDSISIGLVLHLDELIKRRLRPCDLMDIYLSHPAVAPLINGGELIEYGAHLVLEGGCAMVTALTGDGVLVVGDAAGLGVNNGLVVRGMDLAVESGRLAAQTVLEAKAKSDFSRSGLRSYEWRMKDSFVLRDMKTYRKTPHFMKNEHLYAEVSKLAANVFRSIYEQDTTPSRHVATIAIQAMRDSGLKLGALVKLGMEGVGAL
jgi:electron transfer flavoprotein-quinone oxidoreductase